MSGPRIEPTTGPTIEEIEPIPTTASVARPVEPGGRFGLRWIVALVVVALVAAASAAGAWYLAGSTGTSSLAGWTPSDSIVYAEARLDLPGDQRQQLGNFLAHLPGFKDQSILDDKIAEALDRSISGLTSGSHDYGTEIRPWFGGEIAVSVGPLPTVDENAHTAPRIRALLLASTKDRAATDAWVGRLLTESGVTVRSDTYKGVTLRVTGGDGQQAAVGVLDKVLLVGDVDSVKASIDTGGTAGLAANADFKGGTDRLAGDHLGASYVNLRAYFDWIRRIGGGSSVAGVSSGTLDPKLLALVPAWVATDIRATDGDALTTRSVMPHASGIPVIARGASVLTPHIPASAFAVVDAHDFGTAVKAGLDLERTLPSMSDAMKMVDRALGVLGGEDAAIGWIGEVALVASRDGDGVTGGILVSPRDRSKADALARQVRNLIALGGGSAGVSSHDEEHGGTTITIVDAGDLRRFLGAGDLGAPLPAAGQHAEVAFAVRDDIVAIGAPAFVRSALDASGGGALAASARFTTAVGRVGADSPVQGWVDLTAVRELAERTMPAGADHDRYDHDVKPYLVPFDMLAFGSVPASDVDSTTFSVITR